MSGGAAICLGLGLGCFFYGAAEGGSGCNVSGASRDPSRIRPACSNPIFRAAGIEFAGISARIRTPERNPAAPMGAAQDGPHLVAGASAWNRRHASGPPRPFVAVVHPVEARDKPNRHLLG